MSMVSFPQYTATAMVATLLPPSLSPSPTASAGSGWSDTSDNAPVCNRCVREDPVSSIRDGAVYVRFSTVIRITVSIDRFCVMEYMRDSPMLQALRDRCSVEGDL